MSPAAEVKYVEMLDPLAPRESAFIASTGVSNEPFYQTWN